MKTTNKKSTKKPCQIIVDLDQALDDIIRQYISIMVKVKTLCPDDFTDSQINMVFVKSEATYNTLLLKFFKSQVNKKKEPSEEYNDVSIV